jgi:acyl-CoA synthetase (AMP-forming)/AMP-acid ligase II
MISEAIGRLPYLVGQILDWPAMIYPERPAFEWAGGSLGFRELLDSVERQRSDLWLHGARFGQRWGVVFNGTVQPFVSFFALLRVGCAVMPIDHSAGLERIIEAVRCAEIDGIVVSDLTSVDDLISALVCKTVFYTDEPVAVLRLREADNTEGIGNLIDLDPALLLWTSGSTGHPIGVVLQHHAVLANIFSNVRSLGYRDSDRTLLVLSPSHAYALIHQVLCHLALGATVCLPSPPLVGPVLLNYIREFQVTTLSLVPPALQILNRALRLRSYRPESLRLVTVGAAKASSRDILEFRRLLPGTSLAVTYGLTEAGPRVTTYFVQDDDYDSDSIGTALPNVDVRQGRRCGAGYELIIRTRSAMTNLIGKPHEAGTYGENSLATGDIGIVTPETIKLFGRSKRLINRGGKKLSPEAIEQVLSLHPSVCGVKVLPQKHDFWGEVPVAIVRTNSPKEQLEAELREYCSNRLNREECPERIEISETERAFGEKLERLLINFQFDSQ